jgi:hypothetical protein
MGWGAVLTDPVWPACTRSYQSRTFNVEERIKKTKAEVQAEADTAAAALRRELTEATDERDVAVAEVAVCRKAAETAVDTLKKRHQQELDDAVRGCETTAWERQVGPIYIFLFLFLLARATFNLQRETCAAD